MKLGTTTSRIRRQGLTGTFSALWTLLFGLVLLFFPIGGGLTRLSYDLPFALRSNLAADGAVVVCMDEVSHTELNQPTTAPWDRSLHARLVDLLTAEGAKAIVFDILFTEPSTNTAADAELAQAIRRSGRVILAGNFNHRETAPGAEARWEELPFEPFRAGAAAWGNANFVPDPDFGVRRFFPNLDNISDQTNVAWLPWAVARFVSPPNHPLSPPDATTAWLNYYGPPGSVPSVSYSQALLPDGVEPGFFSNKVVFVGALLSADFSGKGKDEFRTPYGYWGRGFAPGVEIHATAALNLMHGDWLRRLPLPAEVALAALVAAVAGYGLMRFQPLAAAGLALAGMVGVAVAAHLLAWRAHLWFAWLMPVVEIETALFCSIVLNSIKLYVEKRLLEESLAAHLSPKLVKRLLSDPSLRQLGGSQQEVSILFTDVANFSRISETMNSNDLVRLMNKYFATALQCIHETDGTVIKLIGDAIFAVWNAPLEQPDHRERACRAALLLREKIVEFDSAHLSVPLRTRVGLHAGEACVGNIGSANRFDYTALGDSINLTSRLEGLNKFLGTSVLVTREVQRVVEDSLVWRAVGHFQFKGLGRVVQVYELVGPTELAGPTLAWREQFAAALHEFRLRHFEAAAQRFQKTIELRRGLEPEITTGTTPMTADGPSRFYLEKIEEFRAYPPPQDWMGEIELREK
jgi:adenylate cyclase